MIDPLRQLEQSHEAKFKLDQEQGFKIQCRCNRLLGEWAADHLGLRGEAAQSYARELVHFNLAMPGPEPVIARIVADFHRTGVGLTERDVIAAFERSHNVAVDQITNDYPVALDTDHVQVGG